MKTIWKIPIELHGPRDYYLPGDAKFMDWQKQNGLLCAWFIVDTLKDEKPVRLRIYGTGHVIDEESAEYLATLQDGPYVWHLFKV